MLANCFISCHLFITVFHCSFCFGIQQQPCAKLRGCLKCVEVCNAPKRGSYFEFLVVFNCRCNNHFDAEQS